MSANIRNRIIVIKLQIMLSVFLCGAEIEAMNEENEACAREQSQAGLLRLRDVVCVPSAQVLEKRLRLDFNDVIDSSELRNLFEDEKRGIAGKRMGILAIADAVFKALDAHHRTQCQTLDRDSKPMTYKRRSDLVKLILQDTPDAIQLLGVMGIFKYDEHE